MNSSKIQNELENLALKFLEVNDYPKKQYRQDSQLTVKDVELFGKLSNSSIIHSRTRSKVLSIVSNNVVIAEYNLDFLHNKKITLYQIPQKQIDDTDDVCADFSSDDNNEPIQKEKISSFDINYGNVYDIIKDFYAPILKLLSNSDCFTTSNVVNTISNIEEYLYKASIFEIENLVGFELFKLYEIISVGFLIYLYQIKLDLYFDFCTAMPNDEINEIYKLVSLSVSGLYDSIMMILLYNSNSRDEKLNEEEKKISNEDLCLQYAKSYFKNTFKPLNDQILSKLSENISLLKDNLTKVTEIVINYLYQSVNNVSISAFSAEFIDEITYIEKIINNLKENKERATYEEIRVDVKKSFDVFTNLLNQNKLSTPYLPPLNSKKYTYTLVVDLDETLVHYVEEENKAYVQVRPFADYFLSEMGKLFEIVIFTAAAEDYADLVLKELDKNNNISHRLYRKHTKQKNGVFLKDLSKLGRDITKVCIIDNNKENFDLQPENGLHISSFVGDQNDTELFLLSKDLVMIINENKNYIRPRLEVIRKKMDARYSNINYNKTQKQ